ncbi:putative isocitrate dehydrogenase, NADP-dependent family protein [Babesia divergens]|uniref:Isocitrate dehydrogenase, NADP-dependent family protein n=1 Tax=Babesia divergens TaxID=32595 RepID=A0AAD9G6C5_BABDI|nr:putative isocitrate dehydrogenase, NADP-dependent family protein [Babesia divergens]
MRPYVCHRGYCLASIANGCRTYVSRGSRNGPYLDGARSAQHHRSTITYPANSGNLRASTIQSMRFLTTARSDTASKSSVDGGTAFDVKGKITVSNPVVELQGDGVSRTIWEMVKSKMIQPYLNLSFNTYDLSVSKFQKNSNTTLNDIVNDLKSCNVALKCSTLDPRLSEAANNDDLGTCSHSSVALRNHLLGALFVEPIIIDNVPRLIRNWKKPIIVSHHVFGDQYRDKGLMVPGAGTVDLVFTPKEPNAPKSRRLVSEFEEGDRGLCLGMYASQKSITSFARCCFRYCILHRLPLYLSVKNAKMWTYDGAFKSTFDTIYEEFKAEFERLGLWYETRKFDRMVSQVLRSEGGFLWACKNYDGDVNADLVSAGFGSRWLTTYTYLSQDHHMCIVEPGHGPICGADKESPSGDIITANPLAIIFTWTRSLKLRAKLDGNSRLEQFCLDLEAASIETVESGIYTKDLLKFVENGKTPESGVDYLCTEDFLDVILKNLKVKLVTFQTPQRFDAATKPLSDLMY